MNETKQINFSKYIVCGCIIVAGCICFDLQCGRDNESGADKVRNELLQARTAQQSITIGIKDAEKSADEITRGIEDSERTINSSKETVEYIGTTLEESARLIAECQSILREVRNRTEKKAKDN